MSIKNMFVLQPNWFDKNTFDFKNGSEYLAIHCSDHFDEWFDKNIFDFKSGSNALSSCCGNHFNKWFDKNTFNYDGYHSLLSHCNKYFDKWFDKKNFNFKDSSDYLAERQHNHFDLWFDKNTFNFNSYSYSYLAHYCYEYTDKWADKNMQSKWNNHLKKHHPKYVKILSLLEKTKTTDKYDLTLIDLLNSEEPNGFINRSLNIIKNKHAISG